MIAIFALLAGSQLAANQAEFVHCSDFGCKTRTELNLTSEQWQSINQLFASKPATALQEKYLIRRAIALMEQYAGQITGTNLDRGGNYPGADIPHQMDCIDESTNTFQYLYALQQHGLLHWHKVAGKQRRIIWFFTHWTALIEDLQDHQFYAVDSWYRDNGEPPYIQLLQDWESKKPFSAALNP